MVQYAVDNQALLVTNDNYKNLSFESEAFKEQIEKRVVGYTWEGEEFALSTERKTEAWYPNLNSIYWRKSRAPLVTSRQKKIAGMFVMTILHQRGATNGVCSMIYICQWIAPLVTCIEA